MSHSMRFFSKMLDTKASQAFNQYNIQEQCFITSDEIAIFRDIQKHIEENGTTPSPEELALKHDKFVYVPSVSSSFDVLAQGIKSDFAKYEVLRLFQGKATPDDPHAKAQNLADMINSQDGIEVLEWIQNQLEQVKKKATVSENMGLSLTEDTDWFIDEYDRRKEGKSFKVWKSRFPTINNILGGGYAGGNMYVWYGRSGRGKSIFTLEEAVEAAMQGAVVLFWGLEMIAFEVYCRAYASISARQGLFTAVIDGINYETGFPSKDVLMAKLPDEFYEALKDFISNLNNIVPGKIIIRAVDDPTFTSRNVRQLEAEIEFLKADVAVVDPVYYLDLEKNTSKTAGGDIAATSRKLRHLAGKTGAVLHVITQADEIKEQFDDSDGNRTLRPPRRNELSKSKQLLQDASQTMGIDTLDGRGSISMGKGRHGGEDEQIECIFLPNFGIVREVPSSTEATDQFTDPF